MSSQYARDCGFWALSQSPSWRSFAYAVVTHSDRNFPMSAAVMNISGIPIYGFFAIILTLLAAFALGSITAFGVTVIGIPSFIMTLAMMQIADGVSAVLVRGQIAYNFPDFITMIGSGRLFGLRYSIIVCILFLIVAHLVLKYTRFGRYVYMVGGNR